MVEEGQNKTNEGGQTSIVGKKYIYDSYGKLRQVIDINNEKIKTTYSYDDISRMTSVENALGEITSYEYDYSNNIITQHTAGGSITRRNYDGLGRLCQEKDPTGKTESYVYDARGNVISKTDKSGTLFTYTYTDTNLLKTVSSTRGDANTEYFYDLAGQVTSVIKNGLNTQYEYYYNGLLKKETSPDTKSISYTYNLDGTKASMTDQFGKITNYEHDARGRLKKVIVDSQDTVYDYYSDGSRKSIVYPNGVKTEYSYNECNKLTNLVNKKIVDLNNEIIIDDFKYTYDYCGNQTSKKENNITTNFTYDNLNRVIDVVKSDGSKVIYSYDNNGNIKNETSVNLGGQSTIINRIFEYDEANFKLKKEIKNTIDLSTGSISASSTSVNADEVITFNLFGSINTDDQALNQLLNETTWSTSSTKLVLNSFKGKTITGSIPKIYWDQMLSNETITIKASLYNKVYQININKKPIPQLSSLTITPTGAYLLGDESKVFTISGKMTDGTIAPTSILINAIWVASSTKINLSGTTGKSITVVIPKANWDLMLTTQVITLKASIGTIKAEAKIYKKGAYVTLKSLSITPSSATFSKGQTKSFTVSGIMSDGTAAPDSLLSTAEWNTTSSSFSLSKTTGKSIYVSFGAAMYIIKESEGSSISSPSEDVKALIVFPTTKNLFATIESISVGATLKISELPSPFQSSMDVENDDVITNKPLIALDTKNVGLLSPLLTYGVGNVVHTETFFEHDNDNNLITVREGSSTGLIKENYEYNELNQLVKLTNGNGLTSYTYNTSGLRNSKTQGTNTTNYYYDGQNVIIETINNNFSARNIMGINPIARETKTSKLYYLYNGYADVVAMSDASGTVINTYSYDIYGKIISANEAGGTNPIRYAGQYYDNESEMYYLRARYYDPGLMRFITEDTNKGKEKDPLSLNLYVYCTGNPIRYFDPSGHEEKEKDADPGNPAENIEATPSSAPGYQPGGGPLQLNAGTPTINSIEPSQNGLRIIKNGITNKLANWSNGGKISLQIIKEAGQTEKFALGLSDYLDEFAANQGAMTWKSFLNPENWKTTVLERLNNPNVEIKFNLTGIDNPWASISRASRGAGGATDWELLQIKLNPQVWDRIKWYDNGTIVGNPFE